jgi:fatty acid desaturase
VVLFACRLFFIVLFLGLFVCFSFPRYLFSPFSPFLKVKKTRRGGGDFLPAFTIFFLLFSSLEASLLCACACLFFLPPLRVFFISGGEEDKDRTWCFVFAVELLEGFLTVESGI